MNPAEMNVAIAEAVGWKCFLSKHGHYIVHSPTGEKFEPMFGAPKFDPSTGEKIVRSWAAGIDLPDYTGSLDCMHGALMTLTPEQMVEYGSHLEGAVEYLECEELGVCLGKLYRPTAAQQAEAFLRAKGKFNPPRDE